MDLILGKVGVYHPVNIRFRPGNAQELHFFNHKFTSWLLVIAYITHGFVMLYTVTNAFDGDGQTVYFVFLII